jgi:hypothetical protein
LKAGDRGAIPGDLRVGGGISAASATITEATFNIVNGAVVADSYDIASATIGKLLLTNAGNDSELNGRINSDVDLTTGHKFKINGSQITSTDLVDSATLTKLGPTITLNELTMTGLLPSDLQVFDGGTGAGIFTQYGILYGNAASPFGVTAPGTTSQVFVGGSPPAFGAVPDAALSANVAHVNATESITGIWSFLNNPRVDGYLRAVDPTGIGFYDDGGNIILWGEDGGQTGFRTLTPAATVDIEGKDGTDNYGGDAEPVLNIMGGAGGIGGTPPDGGDGGGVIITTGDGGDGSDVYDSAGGNAGDFIVTTGEAGDPHGSGAGGEGGNIEFWAGVGTYGSPPGDNGDILLMPGQGGGNTGYVGVNVEDPTEMLDVDGNVNIGAGHTYRIGGVQIASTDLSDATNIAHINANETIANNWVNTAYPWADDEVSGIQTLTGGSINGVVIGATTQADGHFNNLAVNTPIPVTSGGTGQGNSITQYGIAYGSTTAAFGVTAAGTTGQVLLCTTGAAPAPGVLTDALVPNDVTLATTTAPTVTLAGSSRTVITLQATDADHGNPVNLIALSTLHTTNATITTIATLATTTDGIAIVTATVGGKSSATPTEEAGFVITGVFSNVAGTVTQIGSTLDGLHVHDDAGWACAFAVSTSNVLVRVTGDAIDQVYWTCKAEILKGAVISPL